MTKPLNKIEKLITELCPEGVEFKTLLDVCSSITAGGDLPENYLKNQQVPTKEFPYPIFSNGSAENALYGYTDSYKVGCEAVTISARGTIGYHAVRAEKFTPIVRLITLIPKTEIVTAKFLNYALDITEIGHSGGSIPQLTIPNVKKIQIPIPPLHIQQEIVKILDTFTTLEAELEAELEARKKQYEYYREELLTFGEGVKWKTLGEVCLSISAGGDLPENHIKGQTSPSAEFPYPIFANATDSNGLYGYTDGYKIGSDAVTISARGAKIGYHTTRKAKFTPIIRLITLVPNKSVILTQYLNYILDLTPIAGTKGGIPQLTVPTVKKISIPIPPLAEQKRIVAILDKFDALVNDISVGLPAELNARRKQYEYYRNKLLTFAPLEKDHANQ